MFQKTLKGRVPTRSFEGSIDVDVQSPQTFSSFPVILLSQVASILGFLTQNPSLINETLPLAVHDIQGYN